MGVDYYNILDITRSANIADIHKSYRKLALKYHRDKYEGADGPEKFLRIAEAYEVLKDCKKRAVYDQFGEEGLKKGVPEGSGQTGAWTQGYTFHGNAEKVFYEFFGGDNPYQEFFDPIDGDLTMGFGGLHGRGRKKQDPPIERELILTLEEVFEGCTKKMKISRRVMNEDSHTSSIRDKILTITVKSGWTPGSRITFPMEGDQGPNNHPADIVFIVKDKQHDFFRRDGINLIHKAKIPLGQALIGCMVDIMTLDGRILHIPINYIVTPYYVKIVPGEGMPIVGSPEKRGDLIIEFDIVFPKTLTQHKKDVIASALL